VRFNNHTRRLNISGAPAKIEDYSAFNKFLAGGRFSSDDAPEAIVTEDCLQQFSAEAARGRRIFLGTRNRGGVINNPGGPPRSIASVKSDEERAKEASQAIGQEIVLLTLRATNAAPTSVFGIPLVTSSASAAVAPSDVSNDARFEQHAFRIVGVLPSERGPNFNLSFLTPQMMVPMQQA